MNLILISDNDLISPKKARLTGRRFEHITKILKPKLGASLSVGKINGLMGQGKLCALGKESLEIEFKLTQKPPNPLDIIVIMALPRPPMLKRSLQCLASLGIKKIIILNFSRVEKSLWQSSALKMEAIHEDLLLGLEQAKDTVLPEVQLEGKFKPFVEDKLPNLLKKRKAFVAHPPSTNTMSTSKNELSSVKGPSLLIIGPEGGLVDYEVELLKASGVTPVHLGIRILRFEHALTYALGKMS